MQHCMGGRPEQHTPVFHMHFCCTFLRPVHSSAAQFCCTFLAPVRTVQQLLAVSPFCRTLCIAMHCAENLAQHTIVNDQKGMAQAHELCKIWLSHVGLWGAESKKYGRTMSAGGTTTVATPAPPSAASALSDAIAKGQSATAPVQYSAVSGSLGGTAPNAPADHSGRTGQVICCSS